MVRGKKVMKKGLERLKECLRVMLSKNFESVARTLFISTFELGYTPFVLYINLSLHFCAFSCRIWRSFVSLLFARLWWISFSFFFSLMLNFMHV